MKKKSIIIFNTILIILIIITILYYTYFKIKNRYIKELFTDNSFKLFTDFLKSQRLGYNENRINTNKDYINYSTLVDKLLVKDKLSNIPDLHLAKVLGVYNNTSEIDIDKLPDKFIIKVNHWSGTNLVVNKKEITDIEEFKKKIANRFDNKLDKVYTDSYEYLYRFIKPQLFIEEFLIMDHLEYRLHVIHGKVIYIYVKRADGNPEGENIFTIDWKELNVDANLNKIRFRYSKPFFINTLIHIAELLANKFIIDYARIDFFISDNKIYFAEFTMTPHALKYNYTPVEFDELLMEFYKTKNIDYNKINKYIREE